MTIVSFFTFITPVFAETTNVAIPLIDKYPLMNYEAVTFVGWHIRIFGDEGMAKIATGLANFCFTINKIIVEVVDYGIEFLYGINAINGLVDNTISISNKAWTVLFDNFGAALLIVAGLVIFCTFAFKSPQHAFRQFGQLCLVLMLSFGFMAAGGPILKYVNNVALDAQSIMMSAGSGNSGDSVTQIRDKYFDTTVMDPFLLMNFGTTDENEIEKEDPERIDRILNQPEIDESFDSDLAKAELEKKEKSYNNVYMSSSYASYKLAICFFSPLISVALGIPILGISFANFFAQILILVMTWLMPFLMILSIIPRFSSAVMNGFKRMGVGFVAMIFFGVLMMGMFYLIDLIKLIIPGTDVAGYFLESVCIIISIFLIIKFRHKIISAISKDIVNNAGYRGVKQAEDYIGNKAGELRDKLFGNESESNNDEYGDTIPKVDASRSVQVEDSVENNEETEFQRTDQAEESDNDETEGISDDADDGETDADEMEQTEPETEEVSEIEDASDQDEMSPEAGELTDPDELPPEAEELADQDEFPPDVEELTDQDELLPDAEEPTDQDELPPEAEKLTDQYELPPDAEALTNQDEFSPIAETPHNQEGLDTQNQEILSGAMQSESSETQSQEVEQIQNNSSGLHDVDELEDQDQDEIDGIRE